MCEEGMKQVRRSLLAIALGASMDICGERPDVSEI